MSRTAYPLRLPAFGKNRRDAAREGRWVSLNQFIAVAVAEKVGGPEDG